jgi:Holliday junction resolvasome RuvABC ATP-dependent DNA helicase subunit
MSEASPSIVPNAHSSMPPSVSPSISPSPASCSPAGAASPGLRFDPFDRIVGQRRAVPFLKEIRDGICLGAHPHPLLFLGRSGHGKTSIAKSFAESIGAEFIRIDCGPELRSEHLVEKLTELTSLAVVFCDELQGMRKRTQEVLYGAIDANLVPKLDRRRLDRCAPPVSITPFILIGATNEPGRLLPALRARMVSVVMEDYTDADLRAIVVQKSQRYLVRLSNHAIDQVVRASGGSPRNIVQILQAIECTSASWRFGYEMGEHVGGDNDADRSDDGSQAGGPDSAADLHVQDETLVGTSLVGESLAGEAGCQPQAGVEALSGDVVGQFAAARFRPHIPDELIERALNWMGLDKAGLDATGRTILSTIGNHGRATAELIATVLGLDIAYARERLAELRARRLVHAAPGRGWVLTDFGIAIVAELNLRD